MTVFPDDVLTTGNCVTLGREIEEKFPDAKTFLLDSSRAICVRYNSFQRPKGDFSKLQKYLQSIEEITRTIPVKCSSGLPVSVPCNGIYYLDICLPDNELESSYCMRMSTVVVIDGKPKYQIFDNFRNLVLCLKFRKSLQSKLVSDVDKILELINKWYIHTCEFGMFCERFMDDNIDINVNEEYIRCNTPSNGPLVFSFLQLYLLCRRNLEKHLRPIEISFLEK